MLCWTRTKIKYVFINYFSSIKKYQVKYMRIDMYIKRAFSFIQDQWRISGVNEEVDENEKIKKQDEEITMG